MTQEVEKKPASTENQTDGSQVNSKDSFDVPVKKSPLFLYVAIQIPLLIFMVLVMYFLYQSQKN
jgi:hypothetical protein